ncbi:AzlC family ABC transporter permease [Microbulbifer taiwanensis]|uniref:AzlC family ABC transporter permease n=1 Tax=Microbulbifer taiwanensis TaxID=986746 RepID=A0ABW1YLF9_9GAMM|nr:AzlC family ABC transporter permease [Microbulbifer taiwanensis]
MSSQTAVSRNYPWMVGTRDAIPLLGGYIPVAISFGLIAVQAGFSIWETVFISTLIYAGASQFLFVAMVASGAPLWLVVVMTLLINARHVVYGPNLAPWLPVSRWWPWLMHGLTDQIFALAHTRLPQLAAAERLGWFTGAMLLAWFSWIGGTALGAIAGEELTERWPLLGDVMPFALPTLFLVLLAPRFSSRLWSITLGFTIVVALLLKVNGLPNAAIPLAALCGALIFYAMRTNIAAGGRRDG